MSAFVLMRQNKMSCKFYNDKYSCSGHRYTRRLKHMRAGSARKKLPLNVLMFGTSLMGQLADEFLCTLTIKSAIDHRSLATVGNRFTTSHDFLKPRACDPVCATHEFATYSAGEGGNLTTIVNYPPLQRFSKRGDLVGILGNSLLPPRVLHDTTQGMFFRLVE